MSVAVVTDSTACLPAERAAAAGVQVVPLHVVVGTTSYAEGIDITAGQVADLLRSGKEQVSTSRPAPGELMEVYRTLADSGVTQIISAHLSAQISGTVDAAQLAAVAVRDQVEVQVIDSGVLGMALGYAACDGAQAAASGADASSVHELITQRCAAASTVMYLDSLEYLRRGGRVGTAQAILGQALAIKPLLTLAAGEITLLEKVRTRSKALSRLRVVAGQAAAQARRDGRSARVAIHHLGWEDVAEQTREALADALTEVDESGDDVQVDVVELGAVTAVHAGPSTLALAVSPG